jgi:hypothetical protein
MGTHGDMSQPIRHHVLPIRTAGAERLRSLAGKERDVSENRNAGPVKCNALFGGAFLH